MTKGDPDPDRISTSYVERQNLTMRMGMRRFTRLTNGFSKKVENLAHVVSLYASCTTTSPALTRPFGAVIPRPRRWPPGSPITSGRWKRSRRCSIERNRHTSSPVIRVSRVCQIQGK